MTQTEHWLNYLIDVEPVYPHCLLQNDFAPQYELFEIVQHHGRHERIKGRMWDDGEWVYWFDSIKQWLAQEEVSKGMHFWHKASSYNSRYKFGQWVIFKFNSINGYVIGERKLNDELTFCVRHQFGWFFATANDLIPVQGVEDETTH